MSRLWLLGRWGLIALLAAPNPAFADDTDPPRFGEVVGDGASPLVDLVRRATERYRNVENALDDGYEPTACVSGPRGGAIGVRYVRSPLLGDGVLDAALPEALLYEPQPSGRRPRLVGVEYVTLAVFWPAPDRPLLEGHLLSFVDEPNRYGLPAFFRFRVWAWRDNPNGAFAELNPLVSCEAQRLTG